MLLKFNSCKFLIPLRISGSLSCPVIVLNVSGFKLSILILTPSNPLSFIFFAILSRRYPFVVITVFLIPEFFFIILIISKKSFLTVGSPPVSYTHLTLPTKA